MTDDTDRVPGDGTRPEPGGGTARTRHVGARNPRRPRLRRVVLWTAIVAIVVLAAPVVWVQASGSARVRSLDKVKPAPVAIVLGAGLQRDASPSVYLRRRLQAAVDLLNRGDIQVILVSGDHTGAHDEPESMRRWLLDQGVPDWRIVRDDAGYDTYDSCTRARSVYGVTKAIVITQDYHVPRAAFLCHSAGIETQGVGVSSATQDPWTSRGYRLRELPASLKASWDGVTGRSPVGGAAPSGAVQEALTRAAAES